MSIIRRPNFTLRQRDRSVTNNIKLLIATCLAVTTAGCNLPRPWFGPPGPVRYQQNNASYHDPYPDNEAGPEVVGGRPRDFQLPRAEPVRDRVYTDSFYGR